MTRRRRSATALPATLYAAVRERLREDIASGRLTPGQKLPSESAMTAMFGVSRITVRQALDDLKNARLIVTIPGKGAFVAAPAPLALSFDRIEGLSSAALATGRTIHNRRLALARRPAQRDAAAKLGVDIGADVMTLDTLRYVDGVPLSVNRSWMPRKLGSRLARLDLSGRDLVDVYQQELAVPVTSASVEIRATHPTRREARLLGVAPDLPCLVMHRVLRSSADLAVLYEVALFRGDVYTHRSTARALSDA
ncbi:MAG TPA: GntR family transcriptional regulator [Casimicrobiaceae bacterium]|nr:GntR family transcriptional regulator [Casimicrobiaceae bacterium]